MRVSKSILILKGELYFGVKPDGTPIGQIVTEESLREVSQKIGNSIEPKIYPEVRKVTIDDRDCIYVQFEGNNVPYFAFGVAKIRVADEDLTMSYTVGNVCDIRKNHF